jgi:hypothetical protein
MKTTTQNRDAVARAMDWLGQLREDGSDEPAFEGGGEPASVAGRHETVAGPAESFAESSVSPAMPPESAAGPPESYAGPPETYVVRPEAYYLGPPESYAGPAESYGDPAERYANPVERYANPAESYASSAESYGDPAERYASPVESYGDPAERYANPAERYANPAESYTSPATAYAGPTQTVAGPPTTYAGPPETVPSLPTTLPGPPVDSPVTMPNGTGSASGTSESLEIPEPAPIGDELRIPTAWCEMDSCISHYAHPAALGEVDNRSRAIAAGWRIDALGRLACPKCQQGPWFWATQALARWDRGRAVAMATLMTAVVRADGNSAPGSGTGSAAIPAVEQELAPLPSYDRR